MNDTSFDDFQKLIEATTTKAAIEEWRDSGNNQKYPLYNYRNDHVHEVVDLARHIASFVNADMEVVTLAAWFHDSAKPGIGGLSAKNHGETSAGIAEHHLAASGIDPITIARVAEVMKKHVGLTLKKPLEPIEAQVLWEADKILKLGLIGVLHYILNGIRITPGMSLPVISERIREFLPLAKRIADSMVTDRGKAIAQERLRTLQDFSKTLELELNLGIDTRR